MATDIHFTHRVGYVGSLEVLRKLPPEDALVIRHTGLLLLAHNLLATFHRVPRATAIEVEVDYSPASSDDRFAVSARNGFFKVVGDACRPSDHQLIDAILPLELMGNVTWVLDRAHPLVQQSLADADGRDRALHHRLVHQLALEIDLAFPTPP